MNRPFHVKRGGDIRKTVYQFLPCGAFLGIEADAHEEAAGVGVIELRAVNDVAALAGEIGGNGGDNAAPGRTSEATAAC